MLARARARGVGVARSHVQQRPSFVILDSRRPPCGILVQQQPPGGIFLSPPGGILIILDGRRDTRGMLASAPSAPAGIPHGSWGLEQPAQRERTRGGEGVARAKRPPEFCVEHVFLM